MKLKAKKKGNKWIPAAYAVKSPARAPKITTRGAVTSVKHTELLTSILAQEGGAYAVITDRFINPGIPATFPWLSAIANRFDSYTFRKLEFEYIPSCGTTTDGNVFGFVEFDSLDNAPTNLEEFMANEGAVVSAPYSPFRITCSPANLQKFAKERYTRQGVHAVNDGKTYDVGRIIFGAVSTAAKLFGMVMVHYTVDLRSPQVNIADETEARCKKMWVSTGITPAAPFGTAEVIPTGGLDVSRISPTQLQFNDIGQYLIRFFGTGTGFTGAAPTWAGSGGLTTTQVTGGIVNAAAANIEWSILVTVTAIGALLAVTNFPATTIASFSLRIMPYLVALQ